MRGSGYINDVTQSRHLRELDHYIDPLLPDHGSRNDGLTPDHDSGSNSGRSSRIDAFVDSIRDNVLKPVTPLPPTRVNSGTNNDLAVTTTTPTATTGHTHNKTWLFVGGAVVVGAAVALISRKRKRR